VTESTESDDTAAVPDRPRLPGWTLAVVGLAVGLVVGAAVIIGSGRIGRESTEGVFVPVSTIAPGPKPSARAASALVEAIRRSRTATFTLVEDFVRVAPSGVEVVATRTTRVQRPPDALVRTDTAADQVLGGRHVACTKSPDAAPGTLACRSEPAPAVDIDGAVDAEASLITGQAPLYTVGDAGGGCFALVLRVERTAPPYGRRATLCFDKATGAPSRSEITKSDGIGHEVVDRTTASAIRADVTDADLALPPGAVMSP
jgi:hypothetical protein